MMHREILSQLQRQEEVRIVLHLFLAMKRRIHGLNRLFVRLDTFKTPVRYRTKLMLLIDDIGYRIGKIG